MKKKDLINNISEVLSTSEYQDVSTINTLQDELLKRFKIENIIGIAIYLIFLLLSLLMYDKVDNLAFVSIDIFLITLIIFLALAIVSFIIIYIYKDKEIKEKSYLKKLHIFYQTFDIFNFVGIFLTIFLWGVLFVITPVEVSGSSMEPTFSGGDKIIVWHIGYTPVVDDVIIVEANENYFFAEDTEFIIKRVVAVSGDVVTFNNGLIGVNGLSINRVGETFTPEQYKKMMTDYVDGTNDIKYFEYDESIDKYEGIVPEGYCLVLGDNKTNSMDSKSVGLIHQEDVLGKVILRVYPFNKMGYLK